MVYIVEYPLQNSCIFYWVGGSRTVYLEQAVNFFPTLNLLCFVLFSCQLFHLDYFNFQHLNPTHILWIVFQDLPYLQLSSHFLLHVLCIKIPSLLFSPCGCIDSIFERQVHMIVGAWQPSFQMTTDYRLRRAGQRPHESTW